MVQIIEENKKPSFMQNLMQGMGAGLNAYGQYQEKQNEDNALKEMGIDPRIKDPKMRQEAVAMKLKGDMEKKKIFDEKFENAKAYTQIENIFGKKFAQVWDVAPIGGKTELLKQGLDAKIRGNNLEELLKDVQIPGQEPINETVETNEKVARKEPQVDFDKGVTPKERIARQDKRYTQNLPLFEESQKKKIAQEMIGDEIEILMDLSPQIGFAERLNINPKTGDLLIPALASPEAQRFLKTVNDFTIQAKDSYGSRVTNFDLANFMRRLPTLANSEEGRRQILEQMKIINDINKAHENSLHEVFDEYGGIRNIDYDKAQSIAEKRASKQIVELKKKFKDIGSQQDKDYSNLVKTTKSKAPKGMVTVEMEDGEIGYVPANEVKEAIKHGGKVL